MLGIDGMTTMIPLVRSGVIRVGGIIFGEFSFA